MSLVSKLTMRVSLNVTLQSHNSALVFFSAERKELKTLRKNPREHV